MNSKEITELAIKRHDLDASHFQNVYAKNSNYKDSVFLYGRKLVLDELETLLETLPKGSKVLDVGCGTAHLTDAIRKKGYEVYGIEPSEEMYNYARTNFPDIEIKKGISSEIPFADNSFDLIVAFEVLRYLDKQENAQTFKEFYRVLKPEGRFFVTQVNLFSTDLYYLFHNIKSIVCRITKTTHHHCNFTTSASQVREVKRAGFKTVKTVGVFWGSIRFFYKLGSKVGGAYASFLEKFSKEQRSVKPIGKNIAAHLIVIGKK